VWEVEKNLKLAGGEMMTDKDLMGEIERVSTGFHGQIDDLYKAVGMIIVGRLFGWKVMRLASPRSTWVIATELFGDPKLLMEPEGVLAHKSFGLNFCKEAKEYWEFVKGNRPIGTTDRKNITL
jgi:hypothetical protein